jgi:hypothetical protein
VFASCSSCYTLHTQKCGTEETFRKPTLSLLALSGPHFVLSPSRAALRRMPFAARHPQTPNQPTGCDSSDAGSDLQYYSAQDKENQNCQGACPHFLRERNFPCSCFMLAWRRMNLDALRVLRSRFHTDTPGSITSPKNVDRSPLQGRTLKPLLGMLACIRLCECFQLLFSS